MKTHPLALLLLSSVALAACHDPHGGKHDPVAPVYSAAHGCVAVATWERGSVFPELLLRDASEEAYAFAHAWPWRATPFFLEPSRLGSYLLHDEQGGYLVSDGSALLREEELLSDVLLVEDGFESDAEWDLELVGWRKLRLRHRKSGAYLAAEGLSPSPDEAAALWLWPREGCLEPPEASLDATGEVVRRTFDDGALFGFVDTHSHILSNFAFGGGGIFHGAPFHPLGVEHALPDCATYHGEEGRKDLFGYGFDNQDADPTALLSTFLFGETPEPNHATAGWPEFTDWPQAHESSTHQVQYYKWLERAWLGGLRLVVQHATTNQIICDLITGLGVQPTRYSCNDMVAVDRIIEETWNMQDYIDAQEGGPGRGWFRIVTSPEEARRVIGQGKMAVILGIETSNLFDCFLVPGEGFSPCTAEDVVAKLDAYHAAGVRAIFPVHKYDNAFSAGDGQKLFIELGNFIQTGHYSNFTSDCDPETNTVFDKGPAAFPGLVEVRDDYFAPPPNDMSGFAEDPLGTLGPFLIDLLRPGGEEEVCQATGLTDLGETLMLEMIRRGMIIEVDHMPRRSYRRAFEILEQYDYPAAGTHGLNDRGRLYALGGVSKTGFGRCRSTTESATTDDGFQARIALIEDNGGYPAEGFGFDLNGFAGAPGPRFGEHSVCGTTPQDDPITYPFESYAGDVTFHPPRLGQREVDFNTEGLVHIGLVPELIEEVRRDGVTDAELEPLFRSAEGYVRMWEKAERRARELKLGR
jgi:microsomal dipeptidase-like Zn-dependent dipeptidase